MGKRALALVPDQPPPALVTGAQAPPTEALLRQLIANLSADAARTTVLPTLDQLAAERPERLPPARVTAIRALSPALRVILEHLGEGRDNDDIAYRMRIAKDTVETHCRAIRQRLNVRTRSELMALAGLISAVRPDETAPGLRVNP